MGLLKPKNNKRPVKQDKTASSPIIKPEKKKENRVPRDVLESIPYKTTYPTLGIIEDYDGGFSKTYRIGEANFGVETKENMEDMFLDYEKVLNVIGPGQRGQLLIFNKSVDSDSVRNRILMKPENDGYNKYREEWNDFLLQKLQEGRNNLKKDKYFTISVEADNIEAAEQAFRTVDVMFNQNVRRLTKEETKALTLAERLELMYNIYNINTEFSFSKKIHPISDANGKIDYKKISSRGISTKDLIAPDGMDFYSNYFKLGADVFASSFYLDHLPSQVSTDILNTISDVNTNMLLSVTYTPIDAKSAMQMVKQKDTSVNAQISNIQEASHGLDYIPSELENARDNTKELLHDLTSRNQKMFECTILITLFAGSKEELNQAQKSLTSLLSSLSYQCRSMVYQEELAFNTCLPLALDETVLNRPLTTEEASAFMPFTVQELNQQDGDYYGQNAISKNGIWYNQRGGDNYNALVIGKSGSGKSFFTKELIVQRFLNSQDRIVIIDPEGEYSNLVKSFGGLEIPVDTSNSVHINPLDMDMQYAGEGESPIAMKTDYILSLVEVMIGEGQLSAIDKAVVQRSAKAIYREYVNYMNEKRKGGSLITCDREAMPTLADLYQNLANQHDSTAQVIASAIESYCAGSYDVFAHRTSKGIDTDNRIVSYNLKNMQSGLKDLAMQVCMNDAWNRVIDNGKRGLYTDIYIDEFHLFTKTATSAKFMQQIYKRARKWNGAPTAITQNITDLLVNDESVAVVNNCNLIMMMNQAPSDRERLADMYNISPSLQEYMKDKGFGIGLIYNGKTIIPFENEWSDQNAELYKIMNSKVQKEK